MVLIFLKRQSSLWKSKSYSCWSPHNQDGQNYFHGKLRFHNHSDTIDATSSFLVFSLPCFTKNERVENILCPSSQPCHQGASLLAGAWSSGALSSLMAGFRINDSLIRLATEEPAQTIPKMVRWCSRIILDSSPWQSLSRIPTLRA